MFHPLIPCQLSPCRSLNLTISLKPTECIKSVLFFGGGENAALPLKKSVDSWQKEIFFLKKKALKYAESDFVS